MIAWLRKWYQRYSKFVGYTGPLEWRDPDIALSLEHLRKASSWHTEQAIRLAEQGK